MKTETITIKVYNTIELSTTTMSVEQISDNAFRMADNDFFDYRLTLGTEFKTTFNDEGNHEIVEIIKESPYITRRFFLNLDIKKQEYEVLGKEIVKHGGFWQVDFGGIATFNLPKNCALDIDEIFKVFPHGEIID